jgi:GDP-L-fucose synthase
MLRKFHEAKREAHPSVVLWGDGTPTREFFYVEDCAEAMILAVERYESSEPLNLGSGSEIGIRELANKIARVVGYSGDIVWDATKPNGQPRRQLDISRAREALGFSARTSLDDGLGRTYEWMLAHAD